MRPPAIPMKAVLAHAVVVAWLGITVVAIFSMYKLWATREWRLYGGKSVAEQRTALFKHIGFDNYLLRDCERIAARLPPDTDYRFLGDFNRLSYVTYLLIPRIPRPNAGIVVKDTGSELVLDASGPCPLVENTVRVPFEYPPNLPAFLLSILFVCGLAFLFQRWFPGGMSFPQGVSLSLLSGMGAVVVSRALCADAGPGFMVWAAVGGAGFAVLAVRVCRQLGRSYFGGTRPMNWPVLFLAALGLLFAAWSLLMAVVVVPDDWDAWAMWGAKAKVLALGTGSLDEVTRFGSAEYPLLWPSLWAFTGWLAGGWEENWSKGWGAMLLLLTAWQTYIHVARLGSASAVTLRLLAPLLFVTMPCVALVASWGYAEPAYWLALACAWSGLVELGRHPSYTRAILAGLMLTTTMYIKNEGAVFSVLGCAWLLIQRGLGLRQKAIVCLVPAILFAPWFFWTRHLLDLGTSSTGGFLSLNALPHRIATSLGPACAHVLRIWLDVRLWGVAGPILGCAGLWTLLRGKSEDRRDLGVIVCLCLAYLLVVLCGSNDPGWQIGVAWNRLSIHLLLLLVMTQTPFLAHWAGRVAPWSAQRA